VTHSNSSSSGYSSLDSVLTFFISPYALFSSLAISNALSRPDSGFLLAFTLSFEILESALDGGIPLLLDFILKLMPSVERFGMLIEVGILGANGLGLGFIPTTPNVPFCLTGYEKLNWSGWCFWRSSFSSSGLTSGSSFYSSWAANLFASSKLLSIYSFSLSSRLYYSFILFSFSILLFASSTVTSLSVIKRPLSVYSISILPSALRCLQNDDNESHLVAFIWIWSLKLI